MRIGASVEHDVAGFYSPGSSPLDIFPFTVIGAVSHDFFRSIAELFPCHHDSADPLPTAGA